MTRWRWASLIFLGVSMVLAGCRQDETVSAYGASDKVWRLMEMDDQAVRYRATLTFPEPGQITGEAPCNTYTATMAVPYPWFEAGAISTTRLACPGLADETEFLSTLSDMTLSEVLGDTLILSTPEDRKMVFKSDD
ncbi:META domain-containing protein [Roseobacter sp. YSTF-M11]|uniref:META domain-containing protein n=1 Tax=Roseobacter insulae TaxID=2859783 RepID=A0A9X1JZK9_9RHOB|nr:META domain-containing protein [Roseobacter insulae]MBW4707294.1 META domain-containing protein [Roseobacter insulae]